ncbi:MAG: glycosyltransferase family 4 protein [Methanosarcinales archaeon]|nr:glycosyltransferase family 4 protein [Methanosarcinales archaeon]
MSVINFVIDELTVNRLTKNMGWLETYIPEVATRLEGTDFSVVYDQEAGFDLLHIHMPLRLAYRLSNNGDHNYPIIYHGHATEDSFSVGRGAKYSLRIWFKKIASKSNIILCPSRSAEDYFRTLLPGHTIEQLNYGINLAKYSFSEESCISFREQYGIKDNELVVSCVGGISRRKGIDDFINISKRNPELKFMWVGGEYTDNTGIDIFYKMFARQGDISLKDLPDTILVTGYIKDIPAALSASNIFFFPSRHETQGLALIEAAANGRPIITRDLPVFREWLTPGKDCLMGGSEEEFDSCIRQLANDKELRHRLGREARNSAEKYHDINKTSQRLGQIYQELLD